MLELLGETMLNNKNDFAVFVTNFFKNDDVQEQLQQFLQLKPEYNKKAGKVMGVLFTYLVSTRNEQITPQTLNELCVYACENNNFMAGQLVIEELMKQCKAKNPTATYDDALALFRHNYIENGFYMHACSLQSAREIQKHGLLAHSKHLQEEKQSILSHIHYPYHEKSFYAFATGDYNVLYNYGVHSPEWLSYCVNDQQTMASKNKDQAMELILQNAHQMYNLTSERKELLQSQAKTVLDFYFTEPGFAVVIMDKQVAGNNGEPMFRNYDEEQPIEPELFSMEHYMGKKESDYFLHYYLPPRTPVSTPNLMGAAVNYLVQKYSIYEVKSWQSVPANKLAVAELSTVFTLQQQTNNDLQM